MISNGGLCSGGGDGNFDSQASTSARAGPSAPPAVRATQVRAYDDRA